MLGRQKNAINNTFLAGGKKRRIMYTAQQLVILYISTSTIHTSNRVHYLYACTRREGDGRPSEIS